MFIWFVIIFMHPSQSDDILCPEAFECINQSTIVNASNNLINDGYKSHYGSLSSMTADYIYCRGSFSCIEASSMLTTHSRCDGTNSCSKILNIKLKEATSAYILSYGVNALIYSTVSCPSTYIYCYGEQSCAYSLIKGAISIRGYGAYSLLNAYIDSINGSGSLSIDLYGYYSGFGANIICRTGDNCTIHCASNGCTNVHLDCNNNCFLQFASNDTIITNPLNDVLLYDSFNTAIQNDASCTAQVNTMTFDNYAERYQAADIIGNTTNEGPICCRGYMSCQEINKIDYTSAINGSIICSGGTSCYNSAISSNGNIFCGGYYSCQSSSISTIGTVYCYGYFSCDYGAITQASDIYCTGHKSCKYSYISSNGSDLNIYLLGYQSGHNANVSCSASDQCFIFCYGYQSCENVELKCNGICTVYCDEDSMCPNGWTSSPTQHPSAFPSTNEPTLSPTQYPSLFPSTNEPTNTPTEYPTTNPTEKPTEAPVNIALDTVITNYTIRIGCGECDVDEERINEGVYKALIAHHNVKISGTEIVNDEVIIKLFIETDYEHVLDDNIIQKDLEKELRDDYGDIVVYKDDNDEIDDKSSVGPLLSKRSIVIIVCIIAAVVIVMLLIFGVFVWKKKRTMEDIEGNLEMTQNETLDNKDMDVVQTKHDIENEDVMNSTVLGDNTKQSVSVRRDSNSELMYVPAIATFTNEGVGTINGAKCVRCDQIKPGKIYDGDGFFYCHQCSMNYITKDDDVDNAVVVTAGATATGERMKRRNLRLATHGLRDSDSCSVDLWSNGVIDDKTEGGGTTGGDDNDSCSADLWSEVIEDTTDGGTTKGDETQENMKNEGK